MGLVYSTIPAVKAALKSLLDGASLGVQVSYGDIGEQSHTDRVWLGNSTTGDDTPVSLKTGRRRLQEEYSLSIMVQVGSKITPLAAETEVFRIAALIEDAIALDHTLSNVENLLWCLVDGKELETSEGPNRPLSTLEIRLRCVAQLGRQP